MSGTKKFQLDTDGVAVRSRHLTENHRLKGGGFLVNFNQRSGGKEERLGVD
jgi:hypothetical protein